MRKQQGYLMIVAVILIVIMGVLGMAVAYMISSGAAATNFFAQAENAYQLANSGLEVATRELLTPFLSGSNPRLACASLTGNSAVTNSGFDNGEFTVTASAPNYVNNTLSSAITASATSLSLTNAAGFASSGRIVIEGEHINYASISGNTLLGLQRGADGSRAASHVSGAYASQYQCSINSLGGIPSVTSATYQAETQQAIQLPEIWAVGNSSGNNFMLTQWNYPTELQWSVDTINNTNRVNLNDISLLSNADGWAVGNTNSTNFIFLRYQNSAWSVVVRTGACSGQNLLGVSSVSATEAWAVGVRARSTSCSSGNQRYTILRWNGSTWTELTPSVSPTIPADNNNNQNLNHVSVIDTDGNGTGNIGFAVGNSGQILEYNGSNWLADSSPVTNNLFGIIVVSASEAWAVGASGRILRWNGSTWSTFTSPTSTQLNSVSMLDLNNDGLADVGWAVGNNGVAITYNGSSWSSANIAGGANYFGVVTINASEAFAVGAGGAIRHWDGTAWTTTASGLSVQLNMLAYIGPLSQPWSGWQQIFS